MVKSSRLGVARKRAAHAAAASALLFAIGVSAAPGGAIGAEAKPKPKPAAAEDSNAPNPNVSQLQKGQLESWGFGAGIAVTFEEHGKRVEDAQVVNGIVRVTQDRNVLPRIMFETHYFSRLLTEITMKERCMSNGQVKECGIGFFMAAQPGSAHTIEAFGGGIMYGHRRHPGGDDKDTSAFNVGLGLVVDPYAKTLGDGIQRDQPLPAGETAVRFKERNVWGILLFGSFSF